MERLVDQIEARDHLFRALQPRVMLDVGKAMALQPILREACPLAAELEEHIDDRKGTLDPGEHGRELLGAAARELRGMARRAGGQPLEAERGSDFMLDPSSDLGWGSSDLL